MLALKALVGSAMSLESATNILHLLIKRHEETYGKKPEVISSAPGRLDFLNTHQDYKGLPVVSIAINKRTYIALSRTRARIRAVSLNLCQEGVECTDSFDMGKVMLREKGWFGNYVRSVIMSLIERSFEIGGFDLTIFSEIPVGSGLASSAALQVSLTAGISELFDLGLSKKEIAEIAFHSEHELMGIPCGRLDQYGSAMGGVTLIETKPPFNVKTLSLPNVFFVVLDSGIKHSTGIIHPIRISEITTGLRQILSNPSLPLELRRKLSENVYEVDWESLDIESLTPFMENMNHLSRKRIIFTLKMHQSTLLALKILEPTINNSLIEVVENYLNKECSNCIPRRQHNIDARLKLLSGLINFQHVLLRDLYEVSMPILESIRNKALGEGALGVKISGAGLGGSMIALVEDLACGKKVVESVKGLVKGAWIVEEDDGVRIDYPVAKTPNVI